MKEYIKIKNKIVGVINHETCSYTSPRDARKHYFKMYDGLGMSIKILDYLDSKKIDKIIMDFGGKTLETDIAFFWSKGEYWKDGNDEQLILQSKYFNQENKIELQSKL